MKTEIKICGLRSVRDIELINKYDISYAGFIFAESKRRLNLQQALEMKNKLRQGIKSVCVFADMTVSEMLYISNIFNPDIVQLHSNETPDIFCEFKKAIWKSVAIKDANSIDHIENFKSADGLLLDTFNKNARGGTGDTFNWEIVKDLSMDYFIILAGGINHQNIEAAVKTVNPQVIDICSGIENDYGKDEYKLRQVLGIK